LLCIIGIGGFATLAFGQGILQELGASRSAATVNDSKVDVSTTQAWTDAKIDLQPGDQLTITASSEKNCDPQGVSGARVSGLPLASAAPGALIAKLQENGTPMLVGGSNQLKADAAGHLYLGVNGTSVCSGSFSVAVHQQGMSQGEHLKQELGAAAQIFAQGQFGNSSAATSIASALAGGSTAATATPAAAVATLKVSDAPLDATLRQDIDGLPRRVNDQFKNLGDMVNFVIVGSQKQVQDALTAANWHVADTSDTRAALNALLETYQNKDYLAMPMSTLYLFGRPQDFGYEEAEPIAMVASRNHFRLWKAPFTWDGQTVWVGAGTHDIGFAKDKRNGNITHKIDPNVDGERTNIGQTLDGTGKVKTLSYYLPPNPVQDAKNATGDGYTSDGRILVVILK
jgi:hypothetical protein